MKRDIIWIILGFGVIAIGMYLYTLRMTPKLSPLNGEEQSLTICTTLRASTDSNNAYEVQSYQNTKGEFGGFMAVSNLDGGVTYYYDATGAEYEKISSLPESDKTEKIAAWNNNIRNNYPVLNSYSCAALIRKANK